MVCKLFKTASSLKLCGVIDEIAPLNLPPLLERPGIAPLNLPPLLERSALDMRDISGWRDFGSLRKFLGGMGVSMNWVSVVQICWMYKYWSLKYVRLLCVDEEQFLTKGSLSALLKEFLNFLKEKELTYHYTLPQQFGRSSEQFSNRCHYKSMLGDSKSTSPQRERTETMYQYLKEC